MKLSSTLAGLAIVGTVTFGTAGIAFGADGGSTTTTPTPDKQTRITDRCAKAPQVEQKLTDRLTKLNERLTKLNDALAKAKAANKDKVVARIQHRIDNVEKRIQHIKTLQGKVASWVTAHCPAA
jgi:hypothetical protein